jgi:hypothetical protein
MVDALSRSRTSRETPRTNRLTLSKDSFLKIHRKPLDTARRLLKFLFGDDISR